MPGSTRVPAAIRFRSTAAGDGHLALSFVASSSEHSFTVCVVCFRGLGRSFVVSLRTGTVCVVFKTECSSAARRGNEGRRE